MFSQKTPLRIVLVGGGYGVFHAYRQLCARLGRRIGKRHVKLIVISPVGSHQFHGWSSEVLQGIIAHEHQLTSLRQIMPRATHIRGAVVAVNIDNQELAVQVSGMKRIERVPYDHLLLATGSQDRTTGVPGLREHGLSIKRVDGVSGLRQKLITCVDRAASVSDEATRRRLLTFVFAGGGVTGVELAAATAELLKNWQKTHETLRQFVPRVVLLHGGAEILPIWRAKEAKLARYAEKSLKALGVEVQTDVQLTRVTAGYVETSKGQIIATETLVPCLGQVRPVLRGSERLKRSAEGRLIADSRLRAVGQPNIWLAGDTAEVVHPKRGTPCPADALWAIKQGVHVGKNMASAIDGSAIRPFKYGGLGQAASFGVGRGAAELHGVLMTGWLAWIMRLFFFLGFMPSRLTMLQTVIDWLSFAVVGRRQSTIESTDEVASIGGGRMSLPPVSESRMSMPLHSVSLLDAMRESEALDITFSHTEIVVPTHVTVTKSDVVPRFAAAAPDEPVHGEPLEPDISDKTA